MVAIELLNYLHYSANIYAIRAIKARKSPRILNAALVVSGGSTQWRVMLPFLEIQDTPALS
jgi:hypothetical protein